MARILGRKKERELIAFAHSYLAEAFPNPGRKNCPADDALRELARQPRARDESLTSHLSCCSPCFRAYMAHLAEARSKPARSLLLPRTAIAAWPALAVVALAVVVTISSLVAIKRRPSVTQIRPPSPPVGPWHAAPSAIYVPVVIDLTNRSAIRGVEGRDRPTPTLLSFRADLTVLLPLGSEEGTYTVQIKSKSRILWMKSVSAHRESGQTMLHARADLAGLANGSYDLEVHSGALDLNAPILVHAAETH